VLRGIAFGRPGNENVWKRANLLHGSKLRLAREGLQNKTPANHAFLLGIVADDLNPVWRWRDRFDDNLWFVCSKTQAVEHFLTT
jgi:hypothetical protein